MDFAVLRLEQIILSSATSHRPMKQAMPRSQEGSEPVHGATIHSPQPTHTGPPLPRHEPTTILKRTTRSPRQGDAGAAAAAELVRVGRHLRRGAGNPASRDVRRHARRKR